MDLSREDEYFEWVDNSDFVDVQPRIIQQPQIASLQVLGMEEDTDDEFQFPSYDDESKTQEAEEKTSYDEQVAYYMHSPELAPVYLEDDDSLCSSPSLISPLDSTVDAEDFASCDITETVDDTAVQSKPEQHVDYLSHDWPEEDLWASWKFMAANRNSCENNVRLENASWRCWAQKRSNLPTISPETVEWSKDDDATWLYGPLHKQTTFFNVNPAESEKCRRRSSVPINTKPILKKRTTTDVILQRSPTIISTPSSPSLSPTTSGRSSPSNCSRKSVRFSDEVEQFIVVDNTPPLSLSASNTSAIEESPEDVSVCTRIVARIEPTTLKPQHLLTPSFELPELSAKIQHLKYSLTSYDYFAQPGFDYTEYSKSTDDDEEWESLMIGMGSDSRRAISVV